MFIEIEWKSPNVYMAHMIGALAKSYDAKVDVHRADEAIIIEAKTYDETTQHFLASLEKELPASLFLGKSKLLEEMPSNASPLETAPLPLNIAPCPRCQKEMFDVGSRRYYYPFTSCNHCGAQRPLMERYPFQREHTSMRFLKPCKACEEEMQKEALRKNYPLISCLDCAVTLRMQDEKKEHLALSKGEFKKLFEVCAGVITSHKSLLVKTVHGYRKFFIPQSKEEADGSKMLFLAPNRINDYFVVVEQEFNALLSIERPLLLLSIGSDLLKSLYGDSVWTKYPDEGMSILIGAELVKRGIEWVAYKECDEDTRADYKVSFDLPVSPQEDAKLFVNQDRKFFINARRIVFPVSTPSMQKSRLCVAHELACVEDQGGSILIDDQELFDSVICQELYLLEKEPFEGEHPNTRRFTEEEASHLSVLAEHGMIGHPAIGVHFSTLPLFVYYNGLQVKRAFGISVCPYEGFWNRIKRLREGSDRLVERFKEGFAARYEKIDAKRGEADLLELAALLMGYNDSEEIAKHSLAFLGKGGVQVDTRIRQNRFDSEAFLASIISYILAGVEPRMLSYSIFESLGDFIGETLMQLHEKTQTHTIVFSGERFANQALYARIKRNLGRFELLFNRYLPIGKESAVYGAYYL